MEHSLVGGGLLWWAYYDGDGRVVKNIVTDTAQYSPPDCPQAPGTHHNHVRVQIRRRFQNSFSRFFGVGAADYAGCLNGEKKYFKSKATDFHF